MKFRNGGLLLAIACFYYSLRVKATDYAYGYTSMYVDSGNVVRGYHRTEVDYNTDVYYRPYVCGSLYKDGIEVVRACQGGFASATRNTQTTYYTGSSFSALSDHYVDIEYEEEDPYNPGYYFYTDNYGYYFSGSGGHPIDWYYVASGIYNTRPDVSIHLGDTNAQSQIPYAFKPISVVQTDLGCPSGYVGYGAKVVYEVIDLPGAPIKKAGMTPEEIVSSVAGGFSDYRPFATPSHTDANGRFTDMPIGTCFQNATSNVCVDVRQEFRIKVPTSGGEQIYFLGTQANRSDCRDGIRVIVSTGGESQSYTLGTVN